MYTLFARFFIIVRGQLSSLGRGLVTRERIECGSFPRGTSHESSTRGGRFDVIKKVSPAERTEEIKRYPVGPVETASRNCVIRMSSYLEDTLTRINPLNHGVK